MADVTRNRKLVCPNRACAAEFTFTEDAVHEVKELFGLHLTISHPDATVDDVKRWHAENLCIALSGELGTPPDALAASKQEGPGDA